MSKDNVVEMKNTNFITKTFLWMFLGLFATGLIAYYTYASGMMANLLNGGAFQILCLVELVVVLVFSFLSRKLSANVVAILYFVYAIINGVSMSVIFGAFNIKSIAIVFFGSAALFGLFALIGYKTKADLSKVGTISLGVLFVGIILSIINIFLGNGILDIILNWVLLIVFFAVTAYDIQYIKKMQEAGAISNDKLHIYGAMNIYLDFINIFLRLLAIFGKRND